eukprot:1241138-Alexandrium_andersonii.AAC.1
MSLAGRSRSGCCHEGTRLACPKRHGECGRRRRRASPESSWDAPRARTGNIQLRNSRFKVDG